ncbi:SDR family oxidoreductase [Streptomyces sp. NPDC005476]|uniref:SDR family oxidoreductase n=1 Tax=Streptomyces sp. NPDC005476 TaxID=3156882 RepID=UPI00345430DC
MTHTTPQRQTAIVTGAAHGTGAAVARRTAQDGLAGGVIDLDEADCVGFVEGGPRTGDTARVDYGRTRAGLIGFTKSLALSLGWHGITANAIAPGFVVSDMTRASARRLGRDYGKFRRSAAQSLPVGPVREPEDIAHTASFLASREAGFGSGRLVFVAGGPVD